MTPSLADQVRRSDLAHGTDHRLVPSDSFEAGETIGGGYPVTPEGVAHYLDELIDASVPTDPVHLYLVPIGHRIELPEFPPSNLHFDIDQEHQVAAAALAVWDSHDDIRQWMTVGSAGRDDVLLTQDASNAQVKRFPRAAFVSTTQLRRLVLQWAFGDLLPPTAAQWRAASEEEVGWF